MTFDRVNVVPMNLKDHFLQHNELWGRGLHPDHVGIFLQPFHGVCMLIPIAYNSTFSRLHAFVDSMPLQLLHRRNLRHAKLRALIKLPGIVVASVASLVSIFDLVHHVTIDVHDIF